MILIIGKSISAEKEYISINAPGDLREVTAEDLAKRYDSHQFKPKVYARSNNNQFGGGDYSLEEQREILRVHNEYRKTVSPSASNMDEMVSPVYYSYSRRAALCIALPYANSFRK